MVTEMIGASNKRIGQMTFQAMRPKTRVLAALPTLAQALADNGVAIRLSFGFTPTLGFKLVAMATIASFRRIAEGVCHTKQSESTNEQSQPHHGFSLQQHVLIP